MAVHRFRAAYVDLVGGLSERQLVGRGLGHVVELRAGAVGVDVDFVLSRIESGLF